MNIKYITELYHKHRTGMIIKLINDNIRLWSVDDYCYLFNTTYWHGSEGYIIAHYLILHLSHDNVQLHYRLKHDHLNTMQNCIHVYMTDIAKLDFVKFLMWIYRTYERPVNTPNTDYKLLKYYCNEKHYNIMKYLMSYVLIKKYHRASVYYNDGVIISKYMSCDAIRNLHLEKYDLRSFIMAGQDI